MSTRRWQRRSRLRSSNLRVCHLEAGLRSFDPTMPEEHNRRLTDHMSTLLLTHSKDANENLSAEGVAAEKIAFVGNTMIDTLLANVETARALEAWREFGLPNRGYVLVTLHRPALVDDERLIGETLRGLEEIAREIPVVFPVHPADPRALEGGRRGRRARQAGRRRSPTRASCLCRPAPRRSSPTRAASRRRRQRSGSRASRSATTRSVP